MSLLRNSLANNARVWCGLGIFLTVASLIAFAALQYWMPDDFDGIFGISLPSLHYWHQVLFAKSLSPLPNSQFTGWFRIILLFMYIGYVIMIAAARYIPHIQIRRGLVSFALFGLLMALVCPPALSSDPYSYLAYARLALIYHANPYFHSPSILVDHGDPLVHFLPTFPHSDHLRWDLPTTYGPIWTTLTLLIVKPFLSCSIFSQIFLIKVIEVAALLIAALSAKSIAARYAPDYQTAAFLGVGFNPFLIVEGIANAHNDLLMISLLMLCGAYLAKGKPIYGSIFLGLAVGIKFITVAALPWILLDVARSSGKSKWKQLLSVAVLALLPITIGYLPYWHGLATLTSAYARTQSMPMLGPAPIIMFFMPLHIPRAILAIIQNSPLLLHIMTAVLFSCEVIVIYFALSVWLIWNKKEGNWITAWTILAISMIFFLVRYWFPWYLIWALPFTLCRKGLVSFNLLVICLSFGMVCGYLYSAPDHLSDIHILVAYAKFLAAALLVGNCTYLIYRRQRGKLQQSLN